MSPLFIDATSKSPRISLTPNGEMEIVGRSVPENAIGFYKPVTDWLQKYSEDDGAKHARFRFQIEYFNTASSKCLLGIMRILDSMFRRGDDIEIVWTCDSSDNDLIESGGDFEALISCPFEIQKVSNLEW